MDNSDNNNNNDDGTPQNDAILFFTIYVEKFLTIRNQFLRNNKIQPKKKIQKKNLKLFVLILA